MPCPARRKVFEKREVRFKVKRLASFALALVMALSLAACGEGGLSLNPNEKSDAKDGYIGDTLSTLWFDFVVDDAYTCTEYHGYTPDAGNKLVVVAISLKNNCGYSVDMWGNDFVILWDDEENGIDVSLPAGLSDEQFPDEYALGINARKSGVSVFEVPEEFRDFAIWFQEFITNEDYPDGKEGDNFFVYFTPEEK